MAKNQFGASNEVGMYKIAIANPEVVKVKKSYDNPFSMFKFFVPNPVVNSELINVIVK
ncbi:MAG TPA: hypothetical protein VF676_03190 [Flavobacterium sp.]